MKFLGLFSLLFATSSWAVKPGESLFIRIKEANIYQTADARTSVILKVAAGTLVVWKGPDVSVPLMHKIEFTDDSKKLWAGYTHQGNLATKKPTLEVISDDGKAIDAQAFRSSGAATKAMSDTALAWAEKKNLKELAVELQQISDFNRTISNESIQARARAIGLAAEELPVVLPVQKTLVPKVKKGKSK